MKMKEQHQKKKTGSRSSRDSNLQNIFSTKRQLKMLINKIENLNPAVFCMII